MAVSDFLKAWGAAEAKPQAAYRLPAGETDWTISTRPHEPRSTSDQTLTLSYDEDHVDLLFEAQVTTASGYVFQHVLTVPAGLKIDDVSLLEDDIERASRWSQEADGRVTLFLNDAASGPQRLAASRAPADRGAQSHAAAASSLGTVFAPLGDDSTAAAPRRAVDDPRQPAAGRCRTARRQDQVGCGVFRRGDLVGRIAGAAGDGHRGAEPAEGPRAGGCHGAGEWASWRARLDERLSIHGGVVDQIEIHAPQPWNGPYQANLPGQLQARQSPGQIRRLVFRPQVPISGDLLLSITGPLELARGERPSVPDIHVLDIDRPERWFILPRRAQGQSLRWQTRGLTPTAWPAKLVLSADPDAISYQVSGKPVQAVLEPADMPRGPARCGWPTSPWPGTPTALVAARRCSIWSPPAPANVP